MIIYINTYIQNFSNKCINVIFFDVLKRHYSLQNNSLTSNNKMLLLSFYVVFSFFFVLFLFFISVWPFFMFLVLYMVLLSFRSFVFLSRQSRHVRNHFAQKTSKPSICEGTLKLTDGAHPKLYYRRIISTALHFTYTYSVSSISFCLLNQNQFLNIFFFIR